VLVNSVELAEADVEFAWSQVSVADWTAALVAVLKSPVAGLEQCGEVRV
jgi:hypothetical protein